MSVILKGSNCINNMSSPQRGRKRKKRQKDDDIILPKKEMIPIIDDDDALTSPYERHIHFYSNCRHVEKTHVKDIRPQTYYFCSECMIFHVIRYIG